MSHVEEVLFIVKSSPGKGSRVEEGLRLSAALLGMDYLPVVVFVDEGVECLRIGAFSDPGMGDYLKAAADLAGIHFLFESLMERGLEVGDLDSGLKAAPVDMAQLAEMAADSDVVVAF